MVNVLEASIKFDINALPCSFFNEQVSLGLITLRNQIDIAYNDFSAFECLVRYIEPSTFSLIYNLGRSIRTEDIDIERVNSSVADTKTKVLCPKCRGRFDHLYFRPKGKQFLCLHCAKIYYASTLGKRLKIDRSKEEFTEIVRYYESSAETISKLQSMVEEIAKNLCPLDSSFFSCSE